MYLNVGHTGLNASGFAEWVSQSDVKPVYLIHDLIPITHPEFCRAGESQKHRARMRAALSTGNGIICNSQETLGELDSFAVAERLPMPPTVAAPLGVELLDGGSGYEERPSFVVLGTIEGRKNHILLLNIWSRLVDRLGNSAPRLLIIGQRGWEAQEVFDRLDQDPKLRGHVFELNNCADSALASHLRSARALLFPSYVEGYGLPLVEALAIGVPVIASELATFKEVAGDIPEYVPTSNEAKWETTILDYANPESVRRKVQLNRIRDFRPPTWHQHFAIVESWLKTLG